MSGYYVYIIGHCSASGPVGPVKVGITKSLGSRLGSIQTGNWRRVQFAHVFNMGTRDMALEAERTFHSVMGDDRMCGEWFGIEPMDALERLTDIVFTIIEHTTPPDEVQAQLVESGAIDALKIVTDEWGLPN